MGHDPSGGSEQLRGGSWHDSLVGWARVVSLLQLENIAQLHLIRSQVTRRVVSPHHSHVVAGVTITMRAHEMRVSVSNMKPRSQELCKTKQAHTSH